MTRILKIILLFSAVFVLNNPLFGQFGITSTLTLFDISGDKTKLFYPDSTSIIFSATFMADYTKYLNKGKVRLFFEPQFGFQGKKFLFNNKLAVSKVNDNYIFSPDTNLQHNYFDKNGYGKSKLTVNYFRVVPLLGVEVAIGKKHNCYIAAGPLVEILLNARQTNRYIEADKKVQIISYGSDNNYFNLQSYQYGYCISVGFNHGGIWFTATSNPLFNQTEYNRLKTFEIGYVIKPNFWLQTLKK